MVPTPSSKLINVRMPVAPAPLEIANGFLRPQSPSSRQPDGDSGLVATEVARDDLQILRECDQRLLPCCLLWRSQNRGRMDGGECHAGPPADHERENISPLFADPKARAMVSGCSPTIVTSAFVGPSPNAV